MLSLGPESVEAILWYVVISLFCIILIFLFSYICEYRLPCCRGLIFKVPYLSQPQRSMICAEIESLGGSVVSSSDTDKIKWRHCIWNYEVDNSLTCEPSGVRVWISGLHFWGMHIHKTSLFHPRCTAAMLKTELGLFRVSTDLLFCCHNWEANWDGWPIGPISNSHMIHY